MRSLRAAGQTAAVLCMGLLIDFYFSASLMCTKWWQEKCRNPKKQWKKCKGKKSKSATSTTSTATTLTTQPQSTHIYVLILELCDGAGHTTDSEPPLRPCMARAHAWRSQNSSSVRVGSQLSANRLCARPLSARKQLQWLQRHNCNATQLGAQLNLVCSNHGRQTRQ